MVRCCVVWFFGLSANFSEDHIVLIFSPEHGSGMFIRRVGIQPEDHGCNNLDQCGPTRGPRIHLSAPQSHFYIGFKYFLIKSVTFLFLPLPLFVSFACGPPYLLHYTDLAHESQKVGPH
jgi:hypothetical protein